MHPNDIDRAMCVVTGKKFNSIQTVNNALEMSFRDKYAKTATSEFFDIKYFMKGTSHLTSRKC